MNRFLGQLCLLACMCGLLHAAPAPSKPNIIFILADDLGIPGLSCYGGVYKTPNLDALATSGTRFEHCFSAPLCAPSRALLMTGRYAFRTGVTNNGQGSNATPEKDGCVAQLMKQAGYATAVAGKWRQLSYFTTKEDGAKWGFDEFLIWGAGTPEEGEVRKKKADGSKMSRYWDPDYNLNGHALPDPKGKYGPDLLQNFVIDFVRRHKEEPFFVYYPMTLIHKPTLPTPDSKSKDAASQTGKKEKRKGRGDPGQDSIYGDNIAYLDKQIGQLVAELNALHLREKTLIVFTGDNGSVPVGTINGRKIDGHKGAVLEGGSRVPLIASWPGVTPAGAVKKDLVDFSDMLPTFAELGGAKLPDRKIDGHSFAAQLRGEQGKPREWAYVQLSDKRYVRDPRWKLTGDGQLFDMKDAPFEQVLIPADKDDADAKAARARLQSALDTLRDDSSQPAPAVDKKKKKKNRK